MPDQVGHDDMGKRCPVGAGNDEGEVGHDRERAGHDGERAGD